MPHAEYDADDVESPTDPKPSWFVRLKVFDESHGDTDECRGDRDQLCGELFGELEG